MNHSEMSELRWTDAVELASPHNYVLVTTVDQEGRPNAVGIGWFTITSWSPPMVCFSLAPQRYTQRNLEQVPEFVINFPGPEIAREAWFCGTVSGANRDKFGPQGLTALPSREVRPPAIAGATMAWECKVVNQVDTGDHRLYIGNIVATSGDPNCTEHLYSIHYRELIAVDYKAGTLRAIEHKG